LLSERLSFCSLGSSSQYGNCYLVKTADTCVMVDYGVRLRRTEKALRRAGLHPGEIDAIFITHEHTDHTQGLHIKYPLHQRYGIERIFATPRTLKRLSCITPSPPFYPLKPGSTVDVSGIRARGLRKPHDAAQPVAFHFRTSSESLAVVTDLGELTPGLLTSLRGSEYLIFESNHDVQMEQASGRPLAVVRRVLGSRGHLSNRQAARGLSRLATDQTREIMLAHLSCECNEPELALQEVRGRLTAAGWSGRLAAAAPDRFSGWLGALSGNIRPSAGL